MVKFVKCKNVTQFLEKLNAVASIKDSWHKVTRNHELIRKYKHLQFQPILSTISKILERDSVNSHNSCLVTWFSRLVVPKVISIRGPLYLECTQLTVGRPPISKAWDRVSTLDAAQPPDIHTWNGFCKSVPIDHVTQVQYSNSGQITCFLLPHSFFQFVRAYGLLLHLHLVKKIFCAQAA